MTIFDHAMLGVTLPLAAGLQRQFGWRIVAVSCIAAALPDWDGLSILFGPEAYATGHRLWGHNLLASVALGALFAGIEYRFHLLSRARRWAATVFRELREQEPERTPFLPTAGGLVLWCMVGAVAGASHIPADLTYCSAPGIGVWPTKVFWPFSDQSWAWPIVPWGDVGATLVFVGEMFALYRWPSRATWIARGALAAVLVYVAGWWMLGMA